MLGIGVEDPAAHAHMHANPTGGSLFHVNLRVCLGSSGHFVATLHTVSNRVDNSPCSERRPCRFPPFGIRDLCLPRHPEFCEAAGQRHFLGDGLMGNPLREFPHRPVDIRVHSCL